jgi:hypothetical protein
MNKNFQPSPSHLTPEQMYRNEQPSKTFTDFHFQNHAHMVKIHDNCTFKNEGLCDDITVIEQILKYSN